MPWEAITYVSSGLTLVAFLAMLAAWIVKTKTEARERLIRTAKSDQRADLVRNTLEFFDVKIDNLTREQQYNIAIEQIHARASKFKISAVVICFLAVVAAAFSAYAIRKDLEQRKPPVAGPIPQKSIEKEPPEPRDGPSKTPVGSSAWMYVGTRVGDEWKKTPMEGRQPVKTLDIEGLPELDQTYKVTYPVILRAALPTKESASQPLAMADRKGLLENGRKVRINQVVQMPLRDPERTWVWAYIVVME